MDTLCTAALGHWLQSRNQRACGCHSLSCSWRFRRTTATTPSTTFATASVLVRWCMAWSTSATYRYGACLFAFMNARYRSKGLSIMNEPFLARHISKDLHHLSLKYQQTDWTFHKNIHLRCCPGEADPHRYGNSNDSCGVSWPGPPWLQQHVRLTILSVGVLTDRAMQMPIDPSMFWHPWHNTVVNEVWN